MTTEIIKDLESLRNRRKDISEQLELKRKEIVVKSHYIQNNLLPILIGTLFRKKEYDEKKEWVDDLISELVNFVFTLNDETLNFKTKALDFGKKMISVLIKGVMNK